MALFYGDADYICNWFGGEAASLNISYAHAAEFRQAGYAPFIVDGEEYGEVREYGNFSFTRIYEAGHEVPFYQPKASLEFFRRILAGVDVANGETAITSTYNTTGQPNATHTEPYVAIPSATGSDAEQSYTAAITNPITSVPEESPTSVSSSIVSTTEMPVRPRGQMFDERRLEDLL